MGYDNQYQGDNIYCYRLYCIVYDITLITRPSDTPTNSSLSFNRFCAPSVIQRSREEVPDQPYQSQDMFDFLLRVYDTERSTHGPVPLECHGGQRKHTHSVRDFEKGTVYTTHSVPENPRAAVVLDHVGHGDKETHEA